MLLTKDTYTELAASYRGSDITSGIQRKLVPLWCDDYSSNHKNAELVLVFVLGLEGLGHSLNGASRNFSQALNPCSTPTWCSSAMPLSSGVRWALKEDAAIAAACC